MWGNEITLYLRSYMHEVIVLFKKVYKINLKCNYFSAVLEKSLRRRIVNYFPLKLKKKNRNCSVPTQQFCLRFHMKNTEC